jgi:geranylgeranyl pyrophosphate synthase
LSLANSHNDDHRRYIAEHDDMLVETHVKRLTIAFQILDDLLDCEGKVEEVGKSLQKDKGNFLALYGIEKSKQLVQEYTDKALDAIEIFDGKNDKLKALGQMLLKRKS